MPVILSMHSYQSSGTQVNGTITVLNANCLESLSDLTILFIQCLTHQLPESVLKASKGFSFALMTPTGLLASASAMCTETGNVSVTLDFVSNLLSMSTETINSTAMQLHDPYG